MLIIVIIKVILVASVLLIYFATPLVAGSLEVDAESALDRGDCATALQLWKQLAENGDAAVLNTLGIMHVQGTCVPHDFVAAARFFRLAADNGDRAAQSNLARMYQERLQDYLKAVPRTDIASPTTPLDETKLFSYPKLGFQISFPASWVVSDKSGDLPGEHSVEARRNTGTPSGLTEVKEPARSKSDQQLADIAFLKGMRVTILVRDNLPTMQLSDLVSNRVSGIMYMTSRHGDDVDVKPLDVTQFATVTAFVTKFMKRYKDFGQLSTTTTYYDFERDTRTYVISLEAPTDEFDTYSVAFRQIVRSFTFINRK